MSPSDSGTSSTEFAKRRARMVERQLRRRGIEDERVLEAMGAVPRERFVPADVRDRAYRDGALPIGEGQTISQPWIVARMSALLELEGPERVLEVGTGSGYAAAVLARLLLARGDRGAARRAGRAGRATCSPSSACATSRRATGDGSLGVRRPRPLRRHRGDRRARRRAARGAARPARARRAAGLPDRARRRRAAGADDRRPGGDRSPRCASSRWWRARSEARVLGRRAWCCAETPRWPW